MNSMREICYFKGGAYPFESSIGILCNLAMINLISPMDVLKWLGRQPSTLNCYYYAEAFSDFPCGPVNSIIDHFPSSYRVSRFEARTVQLKYCSECLLMGYHSVFHCLPQVEVCLTHNRPLIDVCSGCNSSIFTNSCKNFRSGPCMKCNFGFPPISEQIRYRSNFSVKYKIQKDGARQKKWFFEIVKLAAKHDFYGVHVDKVNSYKFDSAAHAVSAASANKCPYLDLLSARSFRWVSWRDRGAIQDPDTISLERKMISSANRAIDYVRRKYVCSHESCKIHIHSFLLYWDGEPQKESLCLETVAYIFFRLRLSVSSLKEWHPNDIENMEVKYLSHRANINLCLLLAREKFFVILYLKIYEAIVRACQKECSGSVRIVLGENYGVFQDLIDCHRFEFFGGRTYIEIIKYISSPGVLFGPNETNNDIRFYRGSDTGYTLVVGNEGDTMKLFI